MPTAASPYGSVPALKTLYKKLQQFAKEHNRKYADVPNAQFSPSDIINILIIKFLLNVTPDDRDVQRIARESKVVEDAINATIAELFSSKIDSDNTA